MHHRSYPRCIWLQENGDTIYVYGWRLLRKSREYVITLYNETRYDAYTVLYSILNHMRLYWDGTCLFCTTYLLENVIRTLYEKHCMVFIFINLTSTFTQYCMFNKGNFALKKIHKMQILHSLLQMYSCVSGPKVF